MADTLQYEHKWAFVVIPVKPEYFNNVGGSPKDEIVLIGRCGTCDKYITKSLSWAPYGALSTGETGLPRFGCIDPQFGRF